MQKPLFCTMIATLALACSSCGQSPKLYVVNGKVTVNGIPAAGAAVIFQRQGVDLMNEQTVMGVVREDGAFSLVCGPYGEALRPANTMCSSSGDIVRSEPRAPWEPIGSRAIMRTANTPGCMP